MKILHRLKFFHYKEESIILRKIKIILLENFDYFIYAIYYHLINLKESNHLSLRFI
jgi:hypothetical protein